METKPQKHAGYKVVAGLLVLAVAIGVTAYYRFVQSEKHLTERFEYFVSLGPTQTVDGCLNEVLHWSENCSAMLSLCKDSVPRMMSACLDGADRSEYCAGVEDIRRMTSFGYDDCHSRQLDKVRNRACADAYRAIDKFCDTRFGNRDEP